MSIVDPLPGTNLWDTTELQGNLIVAAQYGRVRPVVSRDTNRRMVTSVPSRTLNSTCRSKGRPMPDLLNRRFWIEFYSF